MDLNHFASALTRYRCIDRITSCWQRSHCDGIVATYYTTSGTHTNDVLCVALEVGQGGTGCCCTVHCVHNQGLSLRSIVNDNTGNTWSLSRP